MTAVVSPHVTGARCAVCSQPVRAERFVVHTAAGEPVVRHLVDYHRTVGGRFRCPGVDVEPLVEDSQQ